MTAAMNQGDKPKIAIVGAGALGGFYGAKLARAGNDVHFLLRSDYDAVRGRGLTIISPDGDFTVGPRQIHVYNDPVTMPKADLVIVTLKTTANDQYQTLIEPMLHAESVILTLQNGLGNEERLAELFGAQRIMGGLALIGCNRGPGEGVITNLGCGLIRLGEFAGRGKTDRAEQIARMFNGAGIACEVLDDLPLGRWEKLVWNTPFNGLGAALDLDVAELLASEQGTGLVTGVMGEVIRTAGSLGVVINPQIIDRFLGISRDTGHYQTSMQVDRRQHRTMEIDAIVGAPLRAARLQHVDTPILGTLHELLLAIEHARVR
jgi:2-dehydropantoate 2-reductase